MFAAGHNLQILGILVPTAILIGQAFASAEYDPDITQTPFATQSLKSANDETVVGAIHEVDKIFADNGDSIQSRAEVLHRNKRRPGRIESFFRLVDYDVPPPPPPSFGDEPVPQVSPEEQPQQLYDSTPVMPSSECDTCEPVLGGVVRQSCAYDVENWSPIARWFGIGSSRDPHACSDVGIGHERVMFAPFEIDTTQPTNFTMVRWDSGFGLLTPDRSEYFWSAPGKGPSVSPNSINFQEMRFINETGNDVFSVQSEIPVRFIEPNSGGSTSGLGDMKIATKARLINGKKWQITQIFRTFINTGTASKGVGTGHVSLEPGVLARYEISPSTYVHGEVKFWIPIAADVGFASDVLTYGVGISHVLYETNNFAIIPDLEMVNYDFLSGQKTYNGVAINANGETAINLIPGARFVVGPKGDLGLFEFGISNMIGLGDRYVSDLLRFDFKFTY